jgi:hypothetical protein
MIPEVLVGTRNKEISISTKNSFILIEAMTRDNINKKEMCTKIDISHVKRPVWKSACAEDYKEIKSEDWIGFIWLRIGKSFGHL